MNWQGARYLKAPEERPISDVDIRAAAYADGYRDGHRDGCEETAARYEQEGSSK